MRLLHRMVASVTLAGTGITIVKIALPAQLALAGHRPSEISLAVASLAAGWPVFGLVAGAMLDRYHRPSMLVTGTLCAFVPTLTLLAFLTTGRAEIAMLCLLAFLVGAGEVLTETTGAALLPAIVPKPDLRRANRVLHGANTVGVTLLAPVVATSLMEVSPDASLTAAATVLAISIALQRRAGSNQSKSPSAESGVGGIFAGLRYLLHEPILFGLTALLAGMTVCWGGWTVLIVLYILSPSELGHGATALGLTMGSLGFGSLAGAIWFSPLHRLLGTRALLAVDLVGTALFLAVPAAGLTLFPTIGSAFVAGVGGVAWRIMVGAYQQSSVADGVLGRVITTYRWFRWSGFFAGSFLAGPAADLLGVRNAMGAFATFATLLALSFPFLFPSTREMDRAHRQFEQSL